jgi:hypothetical protein
VLSVGSRSRPLPVTLRPLRGEILYSWLARMAGIYDLAPADLLPGAMSWNHLDLLVNGNGAELLARIGVLTRMQKSALLRMTLGGTRRKWPEKWCVAGPQTSWSTERLVPHLQVCSECLNSDTNGTGTQFLRKRWQSAALTICAVHLTPLQQACIACRHPDWPVCRRTGPRRYRFLCERCESPQDWNARATDADDRCAIGLLASFEQQVLRALANRPVSWRWVGYAEPAEFIRLIDDLLWALTLRCRHSRPIYRLETLPFPLGQRHLPFLFEDHWCAAPPHVRRCLFASVLAIFGNAQARSLLHGRGSYAIRWSELVDRLDTEATIELERRSWLWPPAAHNALGRAIVSVRRQRSVPLARRLFSTDLGKTRRKGKHFY